MSRYLPEKLRDLVFKRAEFRCEYCKAFAHHSYFTFHIEHIISLKHGGATTSENLALACPICNLNKGSDLGTFITNPDQLIRFFNPRIDIWDEHFALEDTGFLSNKTDIGNATIKILYLNHPDSIIERREMLKLNIFY